ncbi:hypothetical protein LSUB1_G007782 [Lachnellula subtilissima]|uniref:Zn(2)-C6 fungal-type domain-containing protein n=1 Tax=Lachnellula subtilissima TaxID=602034 RepID=A0A8H8RCD7_9HELO|nr:hypothetical protein LSUB1_G007782 [Lachnellula subtilissima]
MNNLPPRSDKEIRQLLHKRTKRARTSCYPCRTRKVKCDKGLPCENCSKRGYPELCSFTGPNEVSKDPAPSYNHPATQGTEHRSAQHLAAEPSHRQWTHEAADSGHNMISDTQDLRSPSLHRDSRVDAVSVSSGASRLRARSNISTSAEQDSDFRFAADDGEQGQRESFLGSNSMPAFLRDQSSQVGSIHNSPIHPVEDAILPILGLKGPKSTYPFLPHPETSTERINSELYQALPTDHEIIRLFERYKLSAHSFTPIIPDMEDFEAGICQYLEERALQKRQSYIRDPAHATEHSRPISWVASLFAILASGAQYSHNSSEERQVKSRLYARYSFQCLRMANFLVRPSLSCILTLLVLGTFLQNDMKPEAAWMLLGTTARMAQSLGLHEKQKDSPSPRTKLWEALVWQDSLLSLCFDRPPVTTPSISDTQLVRELRYQDAMNLLCDGTLRAIRDRANGNAPNFVAILENVYRIEEIYQNSIASTGIQSRLSISKRSEMFALRLHISFVIAWICRPALANSRSPERRTEIQLILIEKCHTNLLGCIRAFVRLHSVNSLASSSWPIIHNGLSSALLLGLLGATNTNLEVRQLQGEILDILSAESDNDNDQEQGVGGNVELSAPHVRALAVLRRLYNNRPADPVPHDALDGGTLNQEDQFQPTSNAANAFL